MDQRELRELEARCIQEEPPACKAGCPLGVDGRGFSLAMAARNLDGARAILDKSMPLVGILGRLCEAPCEQYCIRKDLGGAIALGALERFCVENSTSRARILKLPPRPRPVAVLGGGPSSLTVAFDLAKKGYPVTLYHTGGGPGGWLHTLPEADLPGQVLVSEIQRLASLGIRFVAVKILDASLYEQSKADSIYVGQDDELGDELASLLMPIDQQTFAVGPEGLFSGGFSGKMHPFRLITDIFQGRQAATSIDRYLQGASLTASRTAVRQGQTALFVQTRDIASVARVIPVDPGRYNADEVTEEAGRCIGCQCLECVRHCVYLAEHKSYPKAYARRVYNNSAIVKGVHQANSFINSCALCRQCEILCPTGFSMTDLCLEARQQMVEEKRMPPSAHWFAIEEMHSAQGESQLVRHATGQTESQRLFFPGCQLAGIRPHQTIFLYDQLCLLESRTGIWLDCCGAPAHWTGRQKEFCTILQRFAEIWRSMGEPQIIIACSSCLMLFRDHLPEIQVESVWAVLASQAVPGTPWQSPLALSDPCTSRHDEETKGAVRNLLQRMGQPLAELPMSGKLTECCGFGGMQAENDQKLGRKVVEARVAQSEADMLTYCAMCRDRLASTGKPVMHLLDLLYPETALSAMELPASISSRRVQRRELKKMVLARCGEEDASPQYKWETIRLKIPEPVAIAMEERRILEDDIRQVLWSSKKQGRFLAHGNEDRQLASARFSAVTFWVEYRLEKDVYHVLRCWSHRMTINQPLSL
jgi:Fe-S oxidoreductase